MDKKQTKETKQIERRNRIILLLLSNKSTELPRLCSEVWERVLDFAFMVKVNRYLKNDFTPATLRFRYKDVEHEMKLYRSPPGTFGFVKPSMPGYKNANGCITNIKGVQEFRINLEAIERDTVPESITATVTIRPNDANVSVKVIDTIRRFEGVLGTSYSFSESDYKNAEVVDDDNGFVFLVCVATHVYGHHILYREIKNWEYLLDMFDAYRQRTLNDKRQPGNNKRRRLL